MLPTTTSPAMPMGSAARLPISTEDLLPSLAAPAGQPPPQAAGMMAGPGGTPLGAATGSSEPPYDVQMQPDGSAIWLSKTTPAVVIGVVPAPKLPVSMQPKQP